MKLKYLSAPNFLKELSSDLSLDTKGAEITSILLMWAEIWNSTVSQTSRHCNKMNIFLVTNGFRDA
ncbi:hypothetical protein TRL7639_00468 [Falsiruegeria litorea R37]|uniref:Uncharacterized protein n=1 Tax=Falsiruegeria litorea R37 TaxID=1200284 RepID=A0A1Y5RKW0_9RHOB|nr:hypothetical protein TRL7639_00468 [Falsiruegeria litorea R37]